MITRRDEKANEHGSVLVPQPSFVHANELRLCIFHGVLGAFMCRLPATSWSCGAGRGFSVSRRAPPALGRQMQPLGAKERSWTLTSIRVVFGGLNSAANVLQIASPRLHPGMLRERLGRCTPDFSRAPVGKCS